MERAIKTLQIVWPFHPTIDALIAALNEPKATEAEKEVFVVLHYWPYEPVRVYGTFDSEEGAMAYAERETEIDRLNSFSGHSYRVHQVLDTNDGSET
jgi:hypothetical protein